MVGLVNSWKKPLGVPVLWTGSGSGLKTTHLGLKRGRCLDHAEGWTRLIQFPGAATFWNCLSQKMMLCGVLLDSEGPPDMQLKATTFLF